MRKPGGLFGNSGSDIPVNDLKQLETFFYKLGFFLHVLDYTGTQFFVLSFMFFLLQSLMNHFVSYEKSLYITLDFLFAFSNSIRISLLQLLIHWQNNVYEGLICGWGISILSSFPFRILGKLRIEVRGCEFAHGLREDCVWECLAKSNFSQPCVFTDYNMLTMKLIKYGFHWLLNPTN